MNDDMESGLAAVASTNTQVLRGSHAIHDSSGEHGDLTSAKKRRRFRANTRRLNLHLSESLYGEIEHLAEHEGRTMAEILRLGLSLAHLAITERRKGLHLAVVDEEGKTLHKIIMPY